MYRKYMTDSECERMKQSQLQSLHNGIYVGDWGKDTTQ